MDFIPQNVHEAIGHVVSGVIVAFLGYIAKNVRTLVKTFAAIPERMDSAEHEIGKHASRITTLEVEVISRGRRR